MTSFEVDPGGGASVEVSDDSDGGLSNRHKLLPLSLELRIGTVVNGFHELRRLLLLVEVLHGFVGGCEAGLGAHCIAYEGVVGC